MSNPFRTDPYPSLSRTISEIVAPKGEKPAKPYDKYEGKPKPKSRVDESHTSEELEGLSITRLRELKKKYEGLVLKYEGLVLKYERLVLKKQLEGSSITRLLELKKKYEGLVLRGDKNASRELADIRGLLRAKGAGSVLDEGRKGLGKTKYGKALAKMGAAVDAYNKSPKPKPPVNPFKKVDESAPTTAAEWTAANRPSRETAKALQAGMKKFLSKYGKGKPAKPAAAPVREGASPCEQGALDAVRRANAADLKEYPGKRGERAHKRLHKTIARVVGEEVESVDEARDYATLLESVVVDLCEDFGLDPDAVMEMAMTLPRLQQSNRELGGLYDRETRGDKKAGSEFKKKLKQQKTEISSKKRYGMGGKVLKGKSRSSDYKRYGD